MLKQEIVHLAFKKFIQKCIIQKRYSLLTLANSHRPVPSLITGIQIIQKSKNEFLYLKKFFKEKNINKSLVLIFLCLL